MACGTPVIAYRRGSVPEVIEDGWTGFLVDGVTGAVEAVARVDQLDRGMIRARFEQRFTARRMAKNYLAAYDRLEPALEEQVSMPVVRYGVRTAANGNRLRARPEGIA
jgi:hypothetical protein